MADNSWPEGKDLEFEKALESLPAGVAHSARLRYYGAAYTAIFGPVVRPPLPPGANPRIARPLHSPAENARAEEVVRLFNNKHPGRKSKLIETFLAHTEQSSSDAPTIQPLSEEEWLGIARDLGALPEESMIRVLLARLLLRIDQQKAELAALTAEGSGASERAAPVGTFVQSVHVAEGRTPTCDHAFERFIKAASPGVKDAVRMMFYDDYEALFEPVVTSTDDCTTHTAEEQAEALELLLAFDKAHPAISDGPSRVLKKSEPRSLFPLALHEAHQVAVAALFAGAQLPRGARRNRGSLARVAGALVTERFAEKATG